MRPMSDENPPTRVRLACEHTAIFRSPPLLGDEVYCVRCQVMRVVIDAPPEYRIRCQRCTVSKMCGASRQEAETQAAMHRKRHPDHKVRVYNGRRHIYTLGAVDEAAQLGLWPAGHFPQEPPF